MTDTGATKRAQQFYKTWRACCPAGTLDQDIIIRYGEAYGAYETARLTERVGLLETENLSLTNAVELTLAERDRFKTALQGLAKGNRSPGVLAIARAALAPAAPPARMQGDIGVWPAGRDHKSVDKG